MNFSFWKQVQHLHILDNQAILLCSMHSWIVVTVFRWLKNSNVFSAWLKSCHIVSTINSALAFRSSHRSCSIKKVLFKILKNSQSKVNWYFEKVYFELLGTAQWMLFWIDFKNKCLIYQDYKDLLIKKSIQTKFIFFCIKISCK